MVGEREALCRVCGDRASGRHYGVASCDGCRGFFKRSVRRQLRYICKERGTCIVDVARRNQCQACRLRKCLQVNMRREAVQHERAPRKTESFTALVASQSANAPTSCSTPQESQSHASPNPKTDHNSSWSIASSTDSPKTPNAFPETKPSIGPPLIQTFGNVALTCEPVRTTFQPDSYPWVGRLPFQAISTTNSEVPREVAAKILFETMRWIKSSIAFQQLSNHDRIILLEHGWVDVFLLTAAQWAFMLLGVDPASPYAKDLHVFREIVEQLMALGTDYAEYACLKGLVLFRPELPGLINTAHVQSIQTQSLLAFDEYHRTMIVTQPQRTARLLLLMASLRSSFAAQALEESYFRSTLGSVPLERILHDVLLIHDEA